MRPLPTLLAIATVLAPAASAAAAPQTGDPARLALRRHDCPAGARYSLGRLPDEILQGLRALGVHGDGAYGACDYARSGKGSLTLSFLVVATGSPGQARTAFTAFGNELRGPSTARVALPACGDGQLAVVDRDPIKATLVVRRRAVVWELSLEANGVKVLPRAQAIAQLRRFALAQKARVAAG